MAAAVSTARRRVRGRPVDAATGARRGKSRSLEKRRPEPVRRGIRAMFSISGGLVEADPRPGALSWIRATVSSTTAGYVVLPQQLVCTGEAQVHLHESVRCVPPEEALPLARPVDVVDELPRRGTAWPEDRLQLDEARTSNCNRLLQGAVTREPNPGGRRRGGTVKFMVLDYRSLTDLGESQEAVLR